jgi:hypothetical protein
LKAGSYVSTLTVGVITGPWFKKEHCSFLFIWKRTPPIQR